MRGRVGAIVALASLLATSVAGQWRGPSSEAGGGQAARVERHDVIPPLVEPGEQAWQSLVIVAGEGVRLSVKDEGTHALAVERSGAWRTRRTPDGEGGVTWTFQAPLAVWAEGDWSTPSVRVSAYRAGGSTSGFQVPGVPLRARSRLPEGARGLRAAGMELPVSQGSGWKDLLAVLPLVLLAGSGAAWWHAGRVRTADEVATAPVVPPPTLAEVLHQALVDPMAASMMLARVARLHGAVRGRGARDQHTTAEVLALLSDHVDLRDAVADVLLLADAVKFGAAQISAAQVGEAAARVAEELDRA